MTMAFQPTTQGDLVRSVRAGDVNVIETRHPAGLTLPRHAHAPASLTCVLRGSFEESFPAATFECGAHSVLFKPAGAVHANRYGPTGADCLLVELPESRLQFAGASFSDIRHVAAGPVAALVEALANEIRADDGLSRLAIEGLVLELLAQVGRGAGPQLPQGRPEWLAPVLEALRTQYREPLVVADLAAKAGVHPAHLTRVFRLHAGVTPSEFVRGQRVDWARAQLLRTDASLAAIAFAAGFADQSHFTRSFARITGTPPGRYRAAVRPSKIASVQRRG